MRVDVVGVGGHTSRTIAICFFPRPVTFAHFHAVNKKAYEPSGTDLVWNVKPRSTGEKLPYLCVHADIVAGTNIRSDAITIVIVTTQVIVWSGAEVAVTVWKMAVRVHIETVQPAIQQVHHEIPWRSRVKHSTMMLWAEKVQEVRRSVARSNGFDRKRWPRRWDLERALVSK